MAKSPNQKLKILYLMQMLLEETDEEHHMSVNDIISRLANHGIKAERKTIYSDIDALRQFGLDIIMQKSDTYGYYIASRDFELPELKLLIDAVQTSKFITEKKSEKLIKKIKSLTSRHEASRLQKQVFISNRVKNVNERIYYNIDTLHEAIEKGRKIGFKYFEYTPDKKKRLRRGGEMYIASPVATTWDDENYYLIAYSDRHDRLVHYRVDKMLDISIQDEIQENKDLERFDPAEYVRKVFGMFGGDKQYVKMRFKNELIGVVIDRFGTDIPIIKDDDKHFIAIAEVAVSPIFIAWIFQFGDKVEILSPQSLIDEIKKRAKAVLNTYQ